MNQPAPPPPVAALDPAGRGLRIRFFWQGDRFGHVIERVDGDAVTAELTSIESDAEADWPESPPLQQLSVETIGTTTTALGVGAAARSHWSISVHPTDRGGVPALQFDVAARCSSAERGFLGSRYQRCGTAVAIEPLGDIAATELEETAGAIELRPASSDGTTIRWAYLVA
ncbi:hypothetical protein [Candidatus Laterigemmans baculatus]|uniref:hypothetical protein n=1 Tax=Candidatus Laterigemmans baculatus TaxID=2770505 RepID=UPI0013DADEA7|nr:hypothetical protein [Candidatus Laterigemmans baculatus]